VSRHYSRSIESIKVLVEGHCDDRGSEEYNIALGTSRAESVKRALVLDGISADRIRGYARGFYSATKLAGSKEQTAQATVDVKRDAKAVAAGISEGWSRDKPLDLNAATKEQLLNLPGVTAAEADRLIAGRPYNEPGEVVTRRIMPKTEYDKIADRVTAKK